MNLRGKIRGGQVRRQGLGCGWIERQHSRNNLSASAELLVPAAHGHKHLTCACEPADKYFGAKLFGNALNKSRHEPGMEGQALQPTHAHVVI